MFFVVVIIPDQIKLTVFKDFQYLIEMKYKLNYCLVSK